MDFTGCGWLAGDALLASWCRLPDYLENQEVEGLSYACQAQNKEGVVLTPAHLKFEISGA